MGGQKRLPGVSRVVNKNGTISFRASGYDPSGRKVAKTFRSLSEANRWKLDLEHAKHHETYVDPSAGRGTLADYFAECMTRSPKLTPKTVYGYWSTANRWVLPLLGHLHLSLVLGLLALRFGEAISLQRRDVEFASTVRPGLVAVRRSTTEVSGGLGMVTGPPKSGRIRTVPIDPALSAELVEHAQRYMGIAEEALFFKSARSNAHVRLNNWRSRVFLPAVERSIGGKLTVHDLRATAITNWLEIDGVSPLMVAAWAGHRSLAVTSEHYFDPTDEQVKMAVDRVGRSTAIVLGGSG